MQNNPDNAINTGFSNRVPEFDDEDFGTVAVGTLSLAESEIKVTKDLKALAESLDETLYDHDFWVEYAKKQHEKHNKRLNLG